MEYGKKIRFGGFNCLKYKRDEQSFIKVSTIMGNWAMEWREDALMYHILDSDLSEDELNALKVVIVNAFMCGSFIDADFQHSVMVAAGELQERMTAESKVEVSEEEDAEILKNLRTGHEMLEEFGKELTKDIEQADA